MNGEILYSSPNIAPLGLKRQRTSGNNSKNLNESFNSSNNNNNAENLAEVNLTGLVEQLREFGIGNEGSPGFSLSPSLENLPVRDPASPVGTPRILPYRNLYKKPLRRFGSLPLEAMGALGPSPPKKIRSMSNIKGRRKTRRNGRKSRKSRRATSATR
jgi:hypothetical protein